MNSQSILDAALYYNKLRFSVIPVGLDKKPLVEWKKNQTARASEEEIREWWKRFPRANVGIITGEVSGIVAVDVENGGKTDDLPPTVISKTGNGGFHFIYKYPNKLIQNATRIRELTDIRGDGGFIVAPPSITNYVDERSGKKRGGSYEWLVDPEDADFVELPPWVFEKCADGRKSKIGWNDFPKSQVKEGMRNNTATKYIGKLLHDLSPELWESAGWTALKEWNNTHAIPPLPENELRTVFGSIAQKETGSRNKQVSTTKVENEAVTICMKDVQPEPISWLWPGRIALGKLTLIAGDPGLGKSLLTIALAANVSKGHQWPLENIPAPLGDVIMLSAEDDPADTIRPRLDAADADCNRIHMLKAVKYTDREQTNQRLFSLKRDIALLEKLLGTLPNCKLLIVDPISAYLDGTESHNNSDIRGLLAPLADLATRCKIAVVCVTHLNKGGGGNALYRTMGSLAFTATARAAYIVTKDQNNPERRLFMPAKNNIAKDTTGLAYLVVETENKIPLIAWELEPVSITADEALATPELDQERTATDEASDFLLETLSNGPMKVSEIQKEARSAGIGEKPLRSARLRLGIKPYKQDFNGGWWWKLPKHEDALGNEDALSKREGILGDGGHLGEITSIFQEGITL